MSHKMFTDETQRQKNIYIFLISFKALMLNSLQLKRQSRINVILSEIGVKQHLK